MNSAEKGQASIPESQTIVSYTDDELASFRDNMVSKYTMKKYKYIPRTPFAVLVEKHCKGINLDEISKQEVPSFSSSSF